MYTSRLGHLLVVAISLLCLAHASWPDFSLLGRRSILARQAISIDVSGSASAASSTTQSSEKPVSTTSTSQTPSSTSTTPTETSTPSSTPTKVEPSSNPPVQSSSSTPRVNPNPASPTTTSTSSTSVENQPNVPASTAQSTSATSEGDKTGSSPTPTPVVSTSIHVVTMTNSDGSKVVATSTSRTTTTPGLNADGASAETSGMSPKTRNTVIGVVVGIGGAIVLGALGVVGWRIWGRKKNSEESDGLMDYDMSANRMEKTEPGVSAAHGPRSPFSSTLENYHQPTQVNASSNF